MEAVDRGLVINTRGVGAKCLGIVKQPDAETLAAAVRL
jgi:hypothetical protein